MTSTQQEVEDALIDCVSAINDGVAEMLIKDTELPSADASLRVANRIRQLRRAIKDEAITAWNTREGQTP